MLFDLSSWDLEPLTVTGGKHTFSKHFGSLHAVFLHHSRETHLNEFLLSFVCLIMIKLRSEHIFNLFMLFFLHNPRENQYDKFLLSLVCLIIIKLHSLNIFGRFMLFFSSKSSASGWKKAEILRFWKFYFWQIPVLFLTTKISGSFPGTRCVV